MLRLRLNNSISLQRKLLWLALLLTAWPGFATRLVNAQIRPQPEPPCAGLIRQEVFHSQLANELITDKAGSSARTTQPSKEAAPTFRFAAGQVMIVTLPAVEKTPAGEAFDEAFGALMTGMDALGYVRDHVRLPMRGDVGPSAALAKNDCPGLVLFRPRPGSSADKVAKAALIVEEDWHSGIDVDMFGNALSLVQPSATEPLRILGPYYSASADSLLAATTEAARGAEQRCTGHPLRVASGSMSSDSNVDRIQAELPRLPCPAPTPCNSCPSMQHDPALVCCPEYAWCLSENRYHSFASGQRLRKSAFFEWNVELAGTKDKDTQCAHESADAEISPDEHCIEHVASMRLLGTTFALSDPKYHFARELVFSGNVAALRAIEAQEPSTQELSDSTQVRTKSATERVVKPQDSQQKEDWEPVDWRDPAHSSQVYRATLHEALRKLSSDVHSVWISNESIEDAAYLASILKRELPDLRVIIDRKDYALIRNDHSRELHGSLVVGTYWLDHLPSGKMPELYTLTRDQAFGLFCATGWLWREERAFRDWPWCRWPNQGDDTSTPIPKVAVIARQRFIPLSGHVPITIPPTFAAIALLILLLVGGDRWRMRQLSLENITTRSTSRRLLHLVFPTPSPLQSSLLTRPFHFAFVSARSALFFATMLLSVLFVFANCPFKYSPLFRFEGCLPHITAVVLGIATLVAASNLIVAVCFVCAANRAKAVQFNEGTSATPAHWAGHWCVALGSAVGAVGFVILILVDADSAFLSRSLDLTSGASPLSVLLLCSLVLYAVTRLYARRLRVLDRCATLDSRNDLLWKQLLDDECAPRLGSSKLGTDLYNAALPSLGVFLAAVFTIVVTAALGLIYRPWSAWSPGGFTLEHTEMHLTMIFVLLLQLGVIGALCAQALAVFRKFKEVLSHLAVGDLREKFRKIAWPRTTAQHLWVSWSKHVELKAAYKQAKLSHRNETCDETMAYTRLHEHVNTLSKEENREAMAGLLSFELAGWVRQISTLLTSLTIATTGLLVCSWLYVFGIRRLMVTVSALLTVGAVLLSMTIFTSLQHDEVLSSIGRRAPQELALHPTWQRVLTLVVFPVVLLLATYYPGLWSDAVNWLEKLFARS